MASGSPSPTPTSSASLVKICGIRQVEQAVAIAQAGAHFLGLNFWPGSKRYLPLAEAEASTWRAAIPRSTSLVGLFVNAESQYVIDTARLAALDLVQLHGDETPDFCRALQDQGLRVIKAFQVRDEASLDVITTYPVRDILLDAYSPGQRGGTGHTFPWDLALTFQQRHPDRTLWLAGGLTAENVSQAVQGVHPAVVDVAGGVESGTPGVKNLALVRDFIHAATRGSLQPTA